MTQVLEPPIYKANWYRKNVETSYKILEIWIKSSKKEIKKYVEEIKNSLS